MLVLHLMELNVIINIMTMEQPGGVDIESLARDMAESDAAYLAQLPELCPPPIDEPNITSNERHEQPGEYWGVALAVAGAQLGMKNGFTISTNGELLLTGTPEAMNHHLNLVGLEIRTGRKGKRIHEEPRTGINTLLSDPVHSALFQHIYSLYTDQSLIDALALSPRTADRSDSSILTQVSDHEGIARLYQENPEHCIRLFLTRMVPDHHHLARSVAAQQRILDGDIDEEEWVSDNRRGHVHYGQLQMDFVQTLLDEGYRPYTLEEVVPFAYEYLVTLMATNPELSPTESQANLPDVREHIGRLLTQLEERSTDDDRRLAAPDN